MLASILEVKFISSLIAHAATVINRDVEINKVSFSGQPLDLAFILVTLFDAVEAITASDSRNTSDCTFSDDFAFIASLCI